MKRGAKPKGQVRIEWTPDFAYSIGLLTADGCLSKNGRHIDFTSKDRDLVLTFRACLRLKVKVSPKWSGGGSKSYHVQFGDVLFYRFLNGVGLTSAKSKTILHVHVPDTFFFDFLRGYFDGDGCSYSYYDPVFPNSFRFYISFISASPLFLKWLQTEIFKKTGILGSINGYRDKPYVQLRYAKKEAVVLSTKMYYRTDVSHLRRKRLKIEKALRIIERRSGEIGIHAAFRAQSRKGWRFKSSLRH